MKVNVRDWILINDSHTGLGAGQARTVGADGSKNCGCSARDAQSSSRVQNLRLQTGFPDKGGG